MMKFVVLLAFVATCIHADDVLSKKQQCEEDDSITLAKLADIQKLDITPCSEVPCVLTKGKKAQINIEYVPKIDVAAAKLRVTGIVAGNWLPFPGLKRDYCAQNAGSCPIKSGEKRTLKFELPIQKFFPQINTTARVQLVNEDDGNSLLCFLIPVSVVNDSEIKS